MISSVAVKIYRFIFCRKIFTKLNIHIYKLALRGIGVLNSEGLDVTGEKFLIEKILTIINPKNIFDVGANTDGYGLDLNQYFPKVKIFAFEPHPKIFKILQKNCKNNQNINTFNIGFSDGDTKGKLWDFADNADLKHTQPTSTISTIYPKVINELFKQKSKYYNIVLTTIDKFCLENKIESVDFLKIDTEGSEFKVLKGAKKLLSANQIRFILFEFNEMNIYSRTFMKDFLDLMPNYTLYRLLPYGLLSINSYQPKIHEIYAYQNIIAINNKTAKIYYSKLKKHIIS